jgi:Ca2+/Na+ antiporter
VQTEFYGHTILQNCLFIHSLFICVGLVFFLLDKAQQEDQTNTKDNIPPIEEATETQTLWFKNLLEF